MRYINIITISFFIAISITSCKNPIEEVREVTRQNIDSILTRHIDFIVSTIPYICYNVQTNYWYPKGTTGKEIFDDNFETGLKGLTRLEARVHEIDTTYSRKVTFEINLTLSKIKETKEEIRKVQEFRNSLLGTLFSSTADLLGSIDEDSNSEDEVKIPKEVSQRMDSLEKAILKFYQEILDSKLLEIERISMEKCGYPDFNEQERILIRENLVVQVSDQIRRLAENTCDIKCIDHIINKLNVTAINLRLLSEIKEIVSLSFNINKSELSKMSRKEITQLENAIIFNFSIDRRIISYESDTSLYNYFNINTYNVFTYNDKPLIQIFYNLGNDSLNMALYYFVNDNVMTSIRGVEGKDNIEMIFKENEIENVNILNITEIHDNIIRMDCNGYKKNYGPCCPNFKLDIDAIIVNNILILSDMRSISEQHNIFIDSDISRQKDNLKPRYVIKNDELKHYYWKANEPIFMYEDETYSNVINIIQKDEEFRILDSKFFIYEMMQARITNVLGSDFAECKNANFNVGDTIQMLIGYGECMWRVLHKNEIKYVNFSLDLENNRISRSVYDGCNLIEGDILKNTEVKDFLAKVRGKNNFEGWIIITSDKKNVFNWGKIQTF